MDENKDKNEEKAEHKKECIYSRVQIPIKTLDIGIVAAITVFFALIFIMAEISGG